MDLRDRILLGGAALLCLLFLAGCKTVTTVKTEFDTDNISKAQRIVVRDAAGEEKSVLETEEEIDAFVKAADVEEWRLAELPEGLTEAGSFTLWQTETVTALGREDVGEEIEICTFRVYAEADCLTIDTGFADISFTFSIPRAAADYLCGLTA